MQLLFSSAVMLGYYYFFYRRLKIVKNDTLQMFSFVQPVVQNQKYLVTIISNTHPPKKSLKFSHFESWALQILS